MRRKEENMKQEDFVVQDGVLVSYDEPGGDIVIPEGVKTIGQVAFRRRNDIINVTLPKSVIR